MLSVIITHERSLLAMLLKKQPVNQRFTFPGPLVLGSKPLIFLQFTTDRDQTDSRRSKPSSRTTFIGEQPNPWNLLQLQDVMSRHRGVKQSRRQELLKIINLLSPAYFLSVKRCSFHQETPDHYDQLTFLLDLLIMQLSKHYHYTLLKFPLNEFTFVLLHYSLGGGCPSQTT